MSQASEQANAYAALILADDGIEITVLSYAHSIFGIHSLLKTQVDKLQTIIKAAKVEVEPIWSTLFAKVQTYHNLSEIAR